MRKILVIALLFSSSAFGQYSPLQSQYMFNPVSMNAGATGSEEAMSLVGTFRAQWIGVPGAPTTEAFTLHAPLRNLNSAVGIQLYADQIGVDKITSFNGLYSYRIKLNKGNFRLGVSGGVSFIQSNYSELQVANQGDEEISFNTRVGILPNFGVGMYYTAEKYFVSVSLPTLLGYKYENAGFRSYADLGNYNLLVGGGYQFDLVNEMKLKPSVLMKIRANNRLQFDFNSKLTLNERFEIGLSYRTEESVIGMIEVKITDQFSALYSFGMPINSIAKTSFGSHELSVKYNFVYKSNSESPRFSGW